MRIAAAAVALLSLTAGSALAGRPAQSPREVRVPWSITAEDEGVESLFGHAAGLGFLDGPEFAVGFSVLADGPGRPSQVTWALGTGLGPLGVALGYSLFPDDSDVEAFVHRIDVGFALRLARSFSLGLGWHGLYSDTNPQLDTYDSMSLSLTLRPLRALSIGITIDRLDTPRLGDTVLPVDGRLSVAVRPGTERVTLAVEANREIRADSGWGVGGSVRAMIIPGLTLGAYGRFASDRLQRERVEWGATLGLSQGAFALDSSVDGAAPTDDEGQPTLSISSMVKIGTKARPSLVTPAGTVVVLPIAGPIPERPAAGLFGSRTAPFVYWLAALDIVARDADVVGLLIELEAPPKWAQIWEIRQALDRIRAAGKRIYVHADNLDMKGMYLAAAADKVYLHPSGASMLTGLAITRSYYGDLLSRIGVRAEIVKYEDYKSAPELATRTGPSEASKEQTKALLATFDRHWLAAVTSGRDKSEEAVRAALADGPQTMTMAVDLGLVDALVYDDAVEETIEADIGRNVRLVRQYRPSPRAWRRWAAPRKVAIVPVVGSIVNGVSSDSPLDLPLLGSASSGDRSVVAALEAAAADSSVVGIVVRVDSGGGAVLASDKMHRVVERIAKKKPLVVSFGNVAASGGYYLAAGAPRILASPVTVTGSIGIFAGKADLSELYRKLGIGTHTEKTAPRADSQGMHRPWSADERATAVARLKAYYDRFVGLVARGRGLNAEAARERAQGRVYDGDKALELKLIDAHGGLWDAIEHVKAEAGVRGELIAPMYVPAAKSALGAILELFSGGASAASLLASAAEPPAGVLGAVLGPLREVAEALTVHAPGEALARLPSVIEVR